MIAETLKKAIGKLYKKELKINEAEIENIIEIPPNPELGDYAFPCFSLSKILKLNPGEIAIEVRGEIGDSAEKYFEEIQTNGPYINFFLNRMDFANKTISEILSKKEKYGSSNIGKKEKFLIEHTSINPNASPHVGRARNALIGDSIVRILKFLNFNTDTHYYVNDISKQIAMLVVSGAEKLSFDKMLNSYIKIAKKVEKSKKLEAQVFSWLKKFEDGDKEARLKFTKITETCIKGQIKILSKLGIEYNCFDYESSYINKAKDLMEELKKSGKACTDKDGRIYIDQNNTRLKHMMKSPVLVLTRSDGTGLYPLRDLVYTIEKMKIAEKNIVVLGEDQKLYFQQLEEVLKILKYKAPKVVHYSFVLISSKGKSRKMSTRKGDVVLLEDFLDELVSKTKKEIKKRKTKGDPEKVAISALKYKILKNSPNKLIQFDLNEALSFEGDTGPYILYSYARASSIAKKSKIKNQKSRKYEKHELEPKETELITKLSQFPGVVESAYKSLNPSLIANYSYQLAQIFNEFYHSCKVIGSEQENFRIALVESFRQVLKSSLWLLGIETMEEM